MSILDTFEENIGQKDRNARGIVGVLLLLIALFHHSVIVAIIGLVLIASAYLRHCPVYAALETNSLDQPDPEPTASKPAGKPGAK